ncbi:MAG: hypothetical protein HQL52_07460 [Magnetococcales bacterium]|nr:hypothetical protein [Magnetococcales bacterium]
MAFRTYWNHLRRVALSGAVILGTATLAVVIVKGVKNLSDHLNHTFW